MLTGWVLMRLVVLVSARYCVRWNTRMGRVAITGMMRATAHPGARKARGLQRDEKKHDNRGAGASHIGSIEDSTRLGQSFRTPTPSSVVLTHHNRGNSAVPVARNCHQLAVE